MPPRKVPEQLPILSALEVSVIVNRQDQPNQIAWTEWRVPVVHGCPADPGSLVMIGAGGTIDPCLLPPITSTTVKVNGTVVPNPNFNNTTPAAPLGFTNVIWQFDGSGNISAYYATSGITVSFGQITSGTNTTADMVVDSGATLTATGTGVIEATELATDTATPVVINGSAPTHAGMLLISQPGNGTAVWADPQVQGLYPAGSNVLTPPPYAPPTTIEPVLIGGADLNNILRNILVTPSGAVVTVSEDQADNANHFAWDTGPDLVVVPNSTLLPLLSIRPKAAATTITFFLTGLDIFMAPSIGEYQLLKNGTLTGATFIDVPNSNAQEDTAATAITGGTRVDSGITQNGVRTNTYSLSFGVPGGTPDIYTLACQCQTSTLTKKASGALRWTEQTQPL